MTTTPNNDGMHADDVAAIDELRNVYDQLKVSTRKDYHRSGTGHRAFSDLSVFSRARTLDGRSRLGKDTISESVR